MQKTQDSQNNLELKAINPKALSYLTSSNILEPYY